MTFDCCAIGLAILLASVGFSKPAIAQGLTDMAADLQLGGRPLVVKLTPERAFASALSRGEPLVLTIEGIEGVSTQPIRVNVFVNKRDANNRTPTTDSNCVGSIQLIPNGGQVRRTSIEFEIPNVTNLDADRPIWITLVPVVGTDNSLPRDVALRVARLYIQELH